MQSSSSFSIFAKSGVGLHVMTRMSSPNLQFSQSTNLQLQETHSFAESERSINSRPSRPESELLSCYSRPYSSENERCRSDNVPSQFYPKHIKYDYERGKPGASSHIPEVSSCSNLNSVFNLETLNQFKPSSIHNYSNESSIDSFAPPTSFSVISTENSDKVGPS